MAQHILVVEDDKSLGEVYQQLLEEEGYRVTLSERIFEKASDVERLCPDLIVLDVWVQQKMDGLLMLQRLRVYPPTRSLPVILCTAASFKDIRQHVEALREQGVPVMYKPFEIDELLQVIRETLSNHEET